MRLFDTINDDNPAIKINQKEPLGVFPHIFNDNDVWFDDVADMSYQYYLEHSPNKIITPTFERIIDMNLNPNVIIGSMIRTQFISKWNKVYNSLINSQYNPLENITRTEHKIGDNTDTTTYGSSSTLIGDNTDTVTYDNKTTDINKRKYKDVVIRNTDTEDGVYGYNTQYPVGDEVGSELTNEITQGDEEHNVDTTDRTKLGTDTKSYDISETTTKDGTDTKNFGIDETTTIGGRDKSPSELIDKELSMLNKTTFNEIVFRDIDSVLTLSIY